MPFLERPLGTGALSLLFRQRGCRTLADAAAHLTALPYGRTTGSEPEQVLLQARGTCSTKHALFALTCREAGEDVKLMIGFFPMAEDNTPGVGAVLQEAGLDAIWEAHCYIRTPDGPLDLTGLPSGETPVHLADEAELEPTEIARKAELHRKALAVWARREGLDQDLEDLWMLRERCIAALQACPSSPKTWADTDLMAKAGRPPPSERLSPAAASRRWS